jgi:hypothetical protein
VQISSNSIKPTKIRTHEYKRQKREEIRNIKKLAGVLLANIDTNAIFENNW